MIYSGNNLIGRIYSGAAGEIRTVRAAVSSNYANTVHQAERPFTLHRWLVGDGSATINLGTYDLSQTIINVRLNTDIDGALRYFAYDRKKLKEVKLALMRDTGNKFAVFRRLDDGDNEHLIKNMAGIYDMKIYVDNGVPTLDANGIIYQSVTRPSNFICTLTTEGSIGEVKFSNNLHLTPAQLDRDTYSREDNNGKRRHAGECVFVDVTKFEAGLPYIWGNVASSGAFSVSDYLIEGVDFEKVAGVKGDGLAYINLLTSSQTLKLDLVVNATPSNFQFITGTNGALRYNQLGNITFSESNIIYFNDAKDKFVSIKISKTDRSITANGLQGEYKDDLLRGDINLFWGNSGRFPEFRYMGTIVSATTDTLDLIPVRLKRNIEPHTTHNGKGGTAGEIGFFDTVSGKFYGKFYGNDNKGAFTEYIPETT